MKRVRNFPHLSPLFSSFPLTVKNCQPEGMNELYLNGWVLWSTRTCGEEQHEKPRGLCHRLIPKITDKLVLLSLFCSDTFGDL